MSKHLIDIFPTHEEPSLSTLIENCTSYSFERCEFNVFETHQYAENIQLMFNHVAVTSMLTGKKTMRMPGRASFDYLPGESLIVPPGELISIDFPEASDEHPTQCIALTISDEVIQKTVDLLDEHHPKDPTWGRWDINPELFHLTNTKELADSINRIVRIIKSDRGKVKDVMMELTLREMMVRLMQTQARVLFESSYRVLSTNNALAASIWYIKDHLTSKISLSKLSDKACMSRANFFKKFKETMGETPAQYIIKERIKLARKKLESSTDNITEVCYSCGFENLSHFIKAFKSEVGMTPKAYQASRSHSVY